MEKLSEYEKQRLKNIEENKRVLASLGLDKSFLHKSIVPKIRAPAKQGTKRKRSSVAVERQDAAVSADLRGDWTGYMTRRRSGRLMGKEPGSFEGFDIDLEEAEEDKPKKIPRNRENVFGRIPGIAVGTTWSTRIDCSADGVHRPTVAGIHGNATEGCYSIALSGGYEDDLDYGVCFTYTGEGGRDLKGTKANPKNLRTAPQSKDQTLSRGNMALTKNADSHRPIRVIRGYKLRSSFAPEEGYRYDGLYTVEKYWQVVGMSGFMVYKFALKRCDGQVPPPWEEDNDEGSGDSPDDDGEHQRNVNDVKNGHQDGNENATMTIDSTVTQTVDKNEDNNHIRQDKVHGTEKQGSLANEEGLTARNGVQNEGDVNNTDINDKKSSRRRR